MTFRVCVFFVVCIALLIAAATCNRLTFPDMMETPRRETPTRVQSYLLPDGRRLYCAQVFMLGSLTVTCDWPNAK